MNRVRRLLVLLGIVLLATAAALTSRVAPAALAQAASNHNATRADFDRLMKEISNWGRWGKDDQMGAVNLITPAKRKSALASVKEGFSVSMARKAETEPALDNPRPITPVMGGAGRGANPAATPSDISGASDTLTVSYHGFVHTHMDTFCHRAYKGLMYNGMPMTSVTEKACTMGSIYAWKDGIITHAVLMDIPRLKGVNYLEPGTRIYPEDLDADEDLSRPEHISAHSSSPVLNKSSVSLYADLVSGRTYAISDPGKRSNGAPAERSLLTPFMTPQVRRG